MVAHQDSLARFGSELIAWLVEANGGEVVVLGHTDSSPERETHRGPVVRPPHILLQHSRTATPQSPSPGKSVHPDAEQRAIIKQWFGVSRFVYNRTVEYRQQPGTKANWKGIKSGILHDLPDWCADVPYQVKSIAIRDACLAVREAKRKHRETGKMHQVNFCSRKSPVQSIFLPASAIMDRGIYPTKLGDLP